MRWYRKNGVFGHILFWVFLWVIISALSSQGHGLSAYLLKNVSLIAMLAAVAYLNWFYLFPTFFQRRKYIAYTLISLSVIYFSYYISRIIIEIWLEIIFPSELILTDGGSIYRLPTSFWHIITGSAPYSTALLASTIIKISSVNLKNERLANTLQLENEKQKIRYLQEQISPHFLFNSLNNIHSLIINDNHQSADYVMRLSELLRYMVYDVQKEKVTLDEEIKIINTYKELIDFRTANPSLTEDFTTSVSTKTYKIPPLLLFSIVENGIKHSRLETHHGAIFHLSITQVNNKLCLAMRNSIAIEPTQQNDKGIGLSNLKNRLSLYYKDRHTFDFKIIGDLAYTDLTINL